MCPDMCVKECPGQTSLFLTVPRLCPPFEVCGSKILSTATSNGHHRHGLGSARKPSQGQGEG